MAIKVMEKFQLGKTYQHTTGEKMRICGTIDSKIYGKCFMGETNKGKFRPIGDTEGNFVNWKEIK